MFGKSLLKSVAVSSLGVLAVGQAAQAALSIDLRLPTTGQPSGAVVSADKKTITLAAGSLTAVKVNIWATVTGTSGNAGYEGLVNAIAAFQSSNVTGGLTGSITAGTRTVGWTNQAGFNGLSSNISADGIGDWGNVTDTPASLSSTMGYWRPRTTDTASVPVDFGILPNSTLDDGNHSTTPTAASNIIFDADNGIEFMVGTLTFTPTATPGGSSVRYSPILPTGGQNFSGWSEDSDADDGAPTGVKSNGSGGVAGPLNPNASVTGGITIAVALPEPTSIGALGLGALAVLRRRRA